MLVCMNNLVVQNRDVPILKFSADTDSRLFRMISVDTDTDSYVRVKNLTWSHLCQCMVGTAPTRLLCSMHKAHAAERLTNEDNESNRY